VGQPRNDCKQAPNRRGVGRHHAVSLLGDLECEHSVGIGKVRGSYRDITVKKREGPLLPGAKHEIDNWRGKHEFTRERIFNHKWPGCPEGGRERLLLYRSKIIAGEAKEN